jgi:hypothetical protein
MSLKYSFSLVQMVLLLSICPFATKKMGKIGVIGSFSKKCLGKRGVIGGVDHE